MGQTKLFFGVGKRKEDITKGRLIAQIFRKKKEIQLRRNSSDFMKKKENILYRKFLNFMTMSD